MLLFLWALSDLLAWCESKTKQSSWLITVVEVTWAPLVGFQVTTSMNQFPVCSHMKWDLMRGASTSNTGQQMEITAVIPMPATS